MVTVLPSFDPGRDIGQSLGSGFGEALKFLGQRKAEQSALDELKSIDEEEFNKMSLPQQLATLQRPFAGLKSGGMIGSELLPTFLKERQRRAGGAIGDTIDPEKKALLERAQQFAGPIQAQEAGEVEEGVQQRGISDPEITQVGPDTQGIPNNMPGEARQILETFPELSSMALRGNPQGMSYDDQARKVQELISKGATPDSAYSQVQSYNNYLKEQAGFYQGVIDDVSKEAENIYGDSPNKNLFERTMIKAADSQIDKGRLEPNSIKNIARESGKRLENVINNVKSQSGRPYFGINEKEMAGKTQSWLEPVIKSGEVNTAIELAMSRDLGVDKDGNKINGPDWGPVKATELVQQRANPSGKQRIQSLDKVLKPTTVDAYKGQEKPVTKAMDAKQKNIEEMANFLSDPKKFKPQDSLTLTRAYAKEKYGMKEEDFQKALLQAKIDRGGEFSDYQNWEETNMLTTDIKPSMKEIFLGIKSLPDWITGKR